MQPFPLNLKRQASEPRWSETREFFGKKKPVSLFSLPPLYFRLFKQERLLEKWQSLHRNLAL